MPSTDVSRRQLLAVGAATVTGLTGCVADGPGTDSQSPSPSESKSPTGTPTSTEPNASESETSVASLSVADFFLYPLAGTHPHVHRQANTQYVVVHTSTSLSFDALRDRLVLTLDGDSVPLAERQPVSWETETVDLAFAVSKDGAFDRGNVRFDGTELESLSSSAVDRLNNPPVFEVSEPFVSPDEIGAGERGTATVRFELRNEGEGPGTFGASLSGNLVSGSTTLTATLDSGANREVTGRVEIHGEGDEATVRLDWGSDKWVARIPVVGATPTASSSTPSAS